MADAASFKVGKDPVQILGGAGAPLGGHQVFVQNRSTGGEVVLGGEGVTKDGGYSLDPGVQIPLGAWPPGSALFAVRGGSTDVVVEVLAI
jgi:hypothetical protein